MQPLSSPIRIGSCTIRNRLFLAPVDGVFDRAFRLLAVQHGVGLTCSEMVSARGLRYSKSKFLDKIIGDPQESPYQVQLSEHEPQLLADAARWLQEDGIADIVDLNMGCPSRLVTGSGNGSALMKSPELVASIVREVRKAIDLPLTVKIRAGWDDSNRNAVDIAWICQEEGADAVTVHGRTRSQAFGGKADWEIIGRVKRRLSIPVIGNGDVVSAADARRIREVSNCDGIMIARGAFGNPWLIDRILKDDESIAPDLDELEETILLHIDLQCRICEEKLAIPRLRKHLAWYVKGLYGAAAFRRTAFILSSRTELETAIRDYFKQLKTKATEIDTDSGQSV